MFNSYIIWFLMGYNVFRSVVIEAVYTLEIAVNFSESSKTFPNNRTYIVENYFSTK